MAKVYIVREDFLPESARRSYHVYLKKGDRLVVEKEYDHGDMTRLGDTQVFVTEEEIYRLLKLEPEAETP